MENNIKWFKQELTSSQIHGSNILAKLRKFASLTNRQRRQLKSIIEKYKMWKNYNETLKGYSRTVIKQRVKWLNKYKNDIERANFTSQSKFHSTVLEEFLYYLFKDLIHELNYNIRTSLDKDRKIFIGGIRAYSNLYFAPKNVHEFIKSPNMKINQKDQDFAIYRPVSVRTEEQEREINVPVVSIECKTYIDKTMLKGSIATAEKIKNGNPYCLFLVATERYAVSYDVDPAYSRIDQIYVFRKCYSDNPIDYHVVNAFFNHVKLHLKRDWSNIEKKLTNEGKIL